MRTKGHTSEKELQDAIKRIGAKPEAKNNLKNMSVWKDYLVNILGVRENTIETERGSNFWDKVRQGIKLPLTSKELPPAKIIHPEWRGRFYIHKISHKVYYRNPKGQFTSYESVGLLPPLKRVSSHAGQRIYTNPSTHQVSYRNAHGQWTQKS